MFRTIKAESGPICGVFAATMTTPDMPFCMVKTLAHEEMQKRRWNGPMHMNALRSVLDRMSVGYREHKEAYFNMKMVDAARALNPDKHYILFVTGHFLTLRGGFGYDQSNAHGVPIDRFWCTDRKVITVLEISKYGMTYDEMFPDEE